MAEHESKPQFDLLDEYHELPSLVYFEPNEGPDAYFVARGYGDDCVEQLKHEEVAYAIRDRLDILPKMAEEIKRLRRENSAFAYCVHAQVCEACNPTRSRNSVCEHGQKLLEHARPGATAGMRVVTYG